MTRRNKVISADYDGCWDCLFQGVEMWFDRYSTPDKLQRIRETLYRRIAKLLEDVKECRLFVGSARQSIYLDWVNRELRQEHYGIQFPDNVGYCYQDYEAFAANPPRELGEGVRIHLDRLLLADLDYLKRQCRKQRAQLKEQLKGKRISAFSSSVSQEDHREGGLSKQKPLVYPLKQEECLAWTGDINREGCVRRGDLQTKIDLLRLQFKQVAAEGCQDTTEGCQDAAEGCQDAAEGCQPTDFYFMDDRIDLIRGLQEAIATKRLRIPKGIRLYLALFNWRRYLETGSLVSMFRMND